MSVLPALIGISIHENKYYYLSWIPSESGPLVIDYGTTEIKGEDIPFDYFINNIKEYNINPRFTIALNNQHIKYNFLESYNPLIDDWNNRNNYDKIFQSSYDSYIYNTKSGDFNIHILKSIKNNIVNQIKYKKYPLANLSVGIFSALTGVKSWYNLENFSNYIILKLSKRNILELLIIRDRQFSSYVIGQKNNDTFNIISFFGNKKYKGHISDIINSFFSDSLDLKDYEKLFYYSIDGNRNDANLFSSFDSNKFILINPFKRLIFDDNYNSKLSEINLSSYAELGNAFGGIDV